MQPSRPSQRNHPGSLSEAVQSSLLRRSDESPAGPDGKCHLLEFVSERQRRVIRSTYSGELNGLIDAIELLLLIQMACHQCSTPGDTTALDMAHMLEDGSLEPPAEAVTDARSVFDSIAATDAGQLAESSLTLHLLAIRDRLRCGTLHALWWSDTRDMLADGLTKGSISRAQLEDATERGRFRVIHPCARSGTDRHGKRRNTGQTIMATQ